MSLNGSPLQEQDKDEFAACAELDDQMKCRAAICMIRLRSKAN